MGTNIDLSVWLALALALACVIGLRLLPTNHSASYPDKRDGPCFDIQRPVAAVRGILLGVAVAALPTGVSIAMFGTLTGGTSVLFGFLMGAVVYNGWLMREWQLIDGCDFCEQVRRRIRSMCRAGIVLGVLLAVLVLNLASSSQ